MPPARLAMRTAFSSPTPAASMTAKAAMTVSPAPVTSKTSRASALMPTAPPRRYSVIPSPPRVSSSASRSSFSRSACARRPRSFSSCQPPTPSRHPARIGVQRSAPTGERMRRARRPGPRGGAGPEGEGVTAHKGRTAPAASPRVGATRHGHTARILGSARRAGKRWLLQPKGDACSRYKGASLFRPTLAELREVVGSWHDEKDLGRRAQALREKLDLEALLLTRGGDGMTLYRRGGAVGIKAEARDVFDVTGAGDTVIAALAVMLAAGVGL